MMQVTKNYVVKDYNTMGEKEFTSYVLGIDIGGTNTNLGVAGIKNKRPTLMFSLNFKSQELPSLVPAIKDALNYAKDKHNVEIKNACIGAAGVVSSNKDYAELTHVKWNVNTKEILNETTLNSAFIINDFQAIGYGINLLNYNNKEDIFLVKAGKTNTESPKETKAIIGAGTGLGKSILAYDEHAEAYIPIPSEGGHSDFPAQDDFEIQLLNFIKKLRNISQPITYEELLSGRGIESIYSFLKEISQTKENKYTKEIENATDKAALISKYRTEDKICGETFCLFARYYGRCAKNFVLDTMATGGLFIAGGIATKNKEIFKTKEFLDEFENAHQRKDVLNQTPIYVITNYDVSIYGACFAAMHNILDRRETI